MSYVYAYCDPRKPGRYPIEDRSLLYKPFYIGKGSDRRDTEHFRYLRLGRTGPFYNYLGKLKREGFKPIIIRLWDNLTENQAYWLEIRLIKILGRKIYGQGPLMNVTEGGMGGAEGIKLSAAHKEKLRITSTGFRHTPETKERIRVANIGKKHSLATLKKMSEAQKGKKCGIRSPEHRKNLSKSLKGLTKSAAHRAKISVTLKGKPLSTETKIKIGEAMKGHKVSLETKAKIGAANKGKKYLTRRRRLKIFMQSAV